MAKEKTPFHYPDKRKDTEYPGISRGALFVDVVDVAGYSTFRKSIERCSGNFYKNN